MRLCLISCLGDIVYQMSPLYYSPQPQDEFDFADLYLNLSHADIKEIGHRPEQFIRSCTVGGKRTSQCQTFLKEGGNQLVFGPESGLCYTYNTFGGQINSSADLDVVRNAGEAKGLEVVLDLGSRMIRQVEKNLLCRFCLTFQLNITCGIL